MSKNYVLFGFVVLGLLFLGCASQTVVTPTPYSTASPTPTSVSTQSSLKTFSSEADLKSFLEASQASGGYRGGIMMGVAEKGAVSAPTAGGLGTPDYSTTNVQVAGVDEADTLKNDGTYLYVVSNGKIKILKAFPATDMKLLSTIGDDAATADVKPNVQNTYYSEIFVSGDKLVAFGNEGFDWGPLMQTADGSTTAGSGSGSGVASGGVVSSGSSGSGSVAGGVPVQTVASDSNSVAAVPPQGVDAKIGIIPIYRPQASFMKIFDISDRSNPKLVKSFVGSGSYLQSRLIDGNVIVVYSDYAYSGGPMPLYAVDGVARQVEASRINYFDSPYSSYAFLTLLSVNVNDASENSRKVLLAGGAENVFVSAKNAFITQTIYNYNDPYDLSWNEYQSVISPYSNKFFEEKISAIDESAMSDWRKESLKVSQAQGLINSLSEVERNKVYSALDELIKAKNQPLNYGEETVIHKFSLGKQIDYVGQGSVAGRVLNQFSMDEYNDYFRVATTTSQQTSFNGERKSENHVFVLDSAMKTVGSVQNLAPGETIYSARFMGDKAFLVTFKQIDPLFVIDLSNPTAPSVLGQLKTPGYSTYLHPFDETHLIGLGKNAEDIKEGNQNFAFPLGVKLSLFDVTDVSTPKELATIDIGDSGSDSIALSEHKAFLFDKARGLLVIPVLEAQLDELKYPNGIPAHTYGDFVFQGAYVFHLDLNGFTLKGKISHSDPEELKKMGYYWGGNQVTRSAYIGDTLYTISNEFVKANDLNSMNELASVKIGEIQPYPYYGGVAMGVAVK